MSCYGTFILNEYTLKDKETNNKQINQSINKQVSK